MAKIDGLRGVMNERDEKLIAKIDGLRGEVMAKVDTLRAETLTKFETVQVQLDELKKQGAERVFLEKQVTTLTARVDMLERRAA